MSTRLSGRTALVTGAASGIGAAIAQLFAEEGAAVVAVDRDGAVDVIVDAIRETGQRAIACRGDVANEADVRRAVDLATATFGGLDHLVNNAGIVCVAPLEETSVEDWDRVMAVNVRSAFLTAKHALPALSHSGEGTIVNLGSVSSFIGQGHTPAYVASKGAVLMLTKAMALDFAARGIRCNCLCPGITDTPLFRYHVDRSADPEAVLAARTRRVPLGHFLSPRDVAKAALYLSCTDSAGITGIAHVVDAGYLAAAEWDNGAGGQRVHVEARNVMANRSA